MTVCHGPDAARPGIGFAWIGLGALALRLLHLWQTHDQLVSRTLMGDAFAYDGWARRIAAGDWLGRDVFYQSPLYAYWLAGIYGLGGNVVAAQLGCKPSRCIRSRRSPAQSRPPENGALRLTGPLTPPRRARAG